jgi:hypothetical protein
MGSKPDLVRKTCSQEIIENNSSLSKRNNEVLTSAVVESTRTKLDMVYLRVKLSANLSAGRSL